MGAYQTNFETDGFETYDLVYVGRGTASDYEGLNVRGKLVLADINQRDEWWINYPVYQAYLKGAVGLIAVQTQGYVWVKLIYPLFMKLIHKIPLKIGKVLFWIMFILILIDIILSCEAVSRRNARDKGVAPQNRFEQFMDKHYTDEFLDKVYANAVATS